MTTQQDTTQHLELWLNPTRRWVETVVVGLNFCPFAKREVDAGRVFYAVNTSQDPAVLLQWLVDECQRLDEHDEIETSLLILPYGFEGFLDYLDLMDLAERLIVAEGYEGVYQVASFHPDYCFAGEAEEDPANYTNRSPYPMMHLIREASLARALAHHPDPESIPDTNIALAREKGLAQMQALRQACFG
jgi:hypothetical protein